MLMYMILKLDMRNILLRIEVLVVSLQVLISTMNQEKPYNLLSQMNIQTSAVVVNQCDVDSCEEVKIEVDNKKITWINSPERGLSKSRNLALKNSSAEICLIADDDLKYINDYDSLVLQAFEDNPAADIISFKVEGIERLFKSYSSNIMQVGYIRSLRLASVEIAFRREKIISKGIRFAEEFGAGAEYSMGEENIFLYDCLKKGLRIYYIPVKIADIHLGDSSWFTGFNERYFFNKGAVFTRMSKVFSIFLILQFAIRKYRLYKSHHTIYDVLRFMMQGRKKYLGK